MDACSSLSQLCAAAIEEPTRPHAAVVQQQQQIALKHSPLLPGEHFETAPCEPQLFSFPTVAILSQSVRAASPAYNPKIHVQKFNVSNWGEN